MKIDLLKSNDITGRPHLKLIKDRDTRDYKTSETNYNLDVLAFDLYR